MTEARRTTSEEARRVGDAIGVDWSRFDLEQFRAGMDVEFERGHLEWRRGGSLLEAVGDVTEGHNGKLKVTLGDDTEVLTPPHGKDVESQLIVDLRRMSRRAGFGPAG